MSNTCVFNALLGMFVSAPDPFGKGGISEILQEIRRLLLKDASAC